ncbi:vascular endothelial growth factor A [Garra rufa]|uniref:vascular endothelial growth factor A n=1 Tax=Garra rufa TaxID=137080 RepID=UPI003CCE7E5F
MCAVDGHNDRGVRAQRLRFALLRLDMKIFIGVSQLTAILLYIPLVQVFTILGNSHSRVMLFHEAWGWSQCRSLERMVEVEQEYPGGVEHIYSPGCVPLLRCSGCCNDDKLACFPISTHNISIQAGDPYSDSLLSPHSHLKHISEQSSHRFSNTTVKGVVHFQNTNWL